MDKIEIIKNQPTKRDVRDVISPAGFEVNTNYLKFGEKYLKTFFLFTYPRFLSSGWFSPIINLAETIDISIHIHPVNVALALRNLRKKTAQIQAQIMDREEKGLVRDPILETAYQDVEDLRDALQQAREKLFEVGVYLTIYGNDLSELAKLENAITSLLESKLVYIKPTLFQQIEGLSSVLPLATDKLALRTPLNSGPISSIFPFISADLSSDQGILYGINLNNSSLVIFDRFSLENANFTVFAKSGSGKSYFAKLEVIRSLMMGTDIIVIDPENEYRNLAEMVGGSYIKISITSPNHINPFEIPIIPPDEEPAEVFKSHVLNLVGLLKLMLGNITPEEDALLDKTILETYASRDITPDKNFSQAQPPLLEDLQSILENTEGGEGLAQRLEKFTRGSYAGFTNQPTNVDIKNRLVVFSIRDLENELRPIAMYVILNFLWNLIRSEFKKRIVVIDEAWLMMKYPDSASFLFGLVKRARKYFLGITTITQEVEDFLNSAYGRPLINNSTLQFLLKQAPATIDLVGKTFNLTDVEKTFLLEANVGEGLFFAGLKHAAIRVIASPLEDQIITTKPEQILELKKPGTN